MSFEAKDYPISDILNKAVFDIPRNQRRYVWKKSSWQDLFEDVLFSITEEKPHFIGSIVLKKGSKKDGLSYYTIIDEKSAFFSCRGVAKQYKSKSFDPQKRTEFLAKLMFNNVLELNQFDFSKD